MQLVTLLLELAFNGILLKCVDVFNMCIVLSVIIFSH